MVIRVQAMVRMKIQRPKYLAELEELKLQADMKYQLEKLKARLAEEQQRNAQLVTERRNSLLSMEAPDLQRPSAGSFADAGGMIETLQDENSKLREKTKEMEEGMRALKAEIEKFKNDKEYSFASNHVKIRQLQDTAKEKDKRIAHLEAENAKLTEQLHQAVANGGHIDTEKKPREKKSIFRTLGSKKEKKPVVSSTKNSDDVLLDSLTGADDLSNRGSKEGDSTRPSERHFPRIPSMPGKFWGKAGAARGDAGDGSDLTEGIDEDSPTNGATTRQTLVKSVEVGVTGAMSSIKGRMSVVKNMYDAKAASRSKRANSKPQDEVADKAVANGKSKPTVVVDRPVRESFNLDALPEVSLPVGWEAKVSRSTGRVYYVNRKLGKSQFERPTLASLKAQKLARQKTGDKANSAQL